MATVTLPLEFNSSSSAALVLRLGPDSLITSERTRKAIRKGLKEVFKQKDLPEHFANKVELRARTRSSGFNVSISDLKGTSVADFKTDDGVLVINLTPVGSGWGDRVRALESTVQSIAQRTQSIAQQQQSIAQQQQSIAQRTQSIAQQQQSIAQQQQSIAQGIAELQADVSILRAASKEYPLVLRRVLVELTLKALVDEFPRERGEQWHNYFNRLVAKKGLPWLQEQGLSFDAVPLLAKAANTPYDQGCKAAHTLFRDHPAAFHDAYLMRVDRGDLGPWKDVYCFVMKKAST